MAIHTELCSFPTEDRETLHGLLFTPASSPPSPSPSTLHPPPCLLLVHGVAMNFYLPPLPVLGQALAERGYHCLCMNTRGHDWIARAGDLTAFGGATYENLEDCLPDLDGALAYLGQRGYQRFVLVGHSLGSVKSLFYQGDRQRPDVAGVISLSCPRQFYAARAGEQGPSFVQRMVKAERLVASGRGEDLMSAPTSGAPGLFAARTFVSKYGRHERNDVRPHAARLGCPLLAIAGSRESGFFQGYARELAEAAGPLGTSHIVDGADHFYVRREPALADLVAEWLTRL